MKIKAYTLDPLKNYTLSCKITASRSQTVEVTTFTLAMNQPPTGGIIYAYPSNGTEGETSFNLIATGWNDTDEDYPLTYSMYYQIRPNAGIVKIN